MTIFKNLFGTKKELAYNLHHPEVSPSVEFAFEAKGVKYYRMAHEFRLPTGRYKWLDAFMMEHEMRMSLPMLEAYLDKLEISLNGTGKGGQINLTTALVTIHNMRTHTKLAFLPETIQRLASVVYFDETEDLRDYDKHHGEKKIKDWLEAGTLDFFLKRPIVELLNLEGISVESLQTYIQQAQETVRALTSDPQTQSSESSLKTETSK